MTASTRAAAVLVLATFLGGCATQQQQKAVDLKESRRVVGTENDVRIDAEVFGDKLSHATTLPLKYDITNHRAQTILIADLLPDSTYDDETQTVTITIGSEVPGEQMLPRLIPIAPGEKKTFNTAAHVAISSNAGTTPWMRKPRAVQLRVNFLTDPTAFQELISIPERAVADKDLAAKLFPKWVEQNETVTTNSLPMHWTGAGADATPAAMPGGARTKRGNGRP